MGNPTIIGNVELTWEGKELVGWDDGTDELAFSYDPDGYRVSKTVNNVTTYYLVSGGKVLAESNGTESIHYFYDPSGSIQAMKYGGTIYYYIKNAEGDILGLVDSSTGDVVATYSYSDWGEPTVTNVVNSTVGDVNPIRYRGYYYDSETGLYYLGSRYYSPTIGRFISADSVSYIGANGGFVSYNLFAYCENDPINHFDPNGHFWQELLTELTQAVQQASGVFATAGSVALLDSPLPGPADLAAGLIAGITFATCLGVAAYNALSTRNLAASIPSDKQNEIARTHSERKYNYWQADLIGNNVVVAMPLTLQEACLRVSMGGSVMCRNEDAARTIVFINGYRNYVGPEVHGGFGYYHHLHPTRNHTGYTSIHIWFYF